MVKNDFPRGIYDDPDQEITQFEIISPADKNRFQGREFHWIIILPGPKLVRISVKLVRPEKIGPMSDGGY